MTCDRCGTKETGEHFMETSLIARMFKHSDDRSDGVNLCLVCKEGLKTEIAMWWYKLEPQIITRMMKQNYDLVDVTPVDSPDGFIQYAKGREWIDFDIVAPLSISRDAGQPVYYNDEGQLVYGDGERVLGDE